MVQWDRETVGQWDSGAVTENGRANVAARFPLPHSPSIPLSLYPTYGNAPTAGVPEPGHLLYQLIMYS